MGIGLAFLYHEKNIPLTPEIYRVKAICLKPIVVYFFILVFEINFPYLRLLFLVPAHLVLTPMMSPSPTCNSSESIVCL